MWVAWVMADPDIEGYEAPSWLRALKPILCGPATVDNLDYVPRDAYMCGISLGPVDAQRIIHYTFVSGDTIVLHAHATGALEMFLASRLYMYLQVYHHRAGRRFDLSMREVFRDTIEELLPGNPLQHMDDYLRLNDWSVLDAVQRWQTEPPGSRRRNLADVWTRILARDLPWHLAFETIAQHDADVAQLQDRVLTAAASILASGARIEIDVATARVAPHNPMTDTGMVNIYDPLTGTVEHARAAELVARLPQHNQIVRVFTDRLEQVAAVHDAAAAALTPPH
jgi:HD superfamily phosphohydrolase